VSKSKEKILKQMLECQAAMADALQRSYKITSLLEEEVSTSPESQKNKGIREAVAAKRRAKRVNHVKA